VCAGELGVSLDDPSLEYFAVFSAHAVYTGKASRDAREDNRINERSRMSHRRFQPLPRGLGVAVAATALFGSTFAQGQAAAPAPAPSAPAPAAPATVTPTPAAPAPTAEPTLDPAAPPAASTPVETAEDTATTAAAGDVAATDPGSTDADLTDQAGATEEESYDFSDLEAEASDESVSGPKLDLYGFADFSYTHWLDGEIPGVKPSFAVGNLNLYLATDFGSNWRSLAEVRFLYLPNGAAPAGELGGAPLDTSVPDHADIQRPLRWGGVEIERVWLEYSFDPLLTLRGGQWLTPYGIWNVDHGSPTIIATYRPYIIGETLFPERQTGLELYGTGYLGDVKLGYHLTLSNGRGPVDAYADMDANKAVGGRLFAETDALLGNIVLGASGYRGRYSNTQLGLGATGFTSTVLESYDEIGYAGDLKWTFEGLHLQSEVVVQEVMYDDEARPADLFGRPGFLPDFRRWGGYVLVGYRTPWFGIMPYVNAEYYDDGPNGAFGKVPAYWFGVNVRPIPSIVLKAQYLYADAEGVPAFGDIEPFSFVTTQAAWSF
jgi:hypothetical protein